MKTNVQVNISLTFSKIMALLIAIMAYTIDLKDDTEGKVFMFSLPVIAVLITGKQVNDMLKQKAQGTKER